jgi:hypothetical protein
MRFAHRRPVLVIALLCQLATAAHVPMVRANTGSNAPAGLEHCADQAVPDASHAIEHKGRSAGDGHAGHVGSCCCDLGQCPCAAAAAVVGTVPLSHATEHLPVTLLYRVPSMPQLGSALFRPPI